MLPENQKLLLITSSCCGYEDSTEASVKCEDITTPSQIASLVSNLLANYDVMQLVLKQDSFADDLANVGYRRIADCDKLKNAKHDPIIFIFNTKDSYSYQHPKRVNLDDNN